MYYAANNQKIADKKKADYQEGLEKSRADSAAQSHDSCIKDLEKSLVQSCKSYMKDPEKCRADNAARSHKSYMKHPEKSHADSAARSCKIYEKDLEKSPSRLNETGLAISYKIKKTDAVIGVRTRGLGGLQPPPTMY